MKRYIIAFIALFMSALTYGQSYQKVTDKEQAGQIVREIQRVSSEIETLKCEFWQSKTMSVLSDTMCSTGLMYYQKDDKLRWEYLSPESISFVANKGSVSMRRNGQTVRNEGVRIFSEISKILLGCISGENLIDENNFDVVYSRNKIHFKIELVPKQRKMRMFISKICMYFDTSDYDICSVEMWKNSDCTCIVLKNKRINEKISETVFAL